MLNFGHEAKNKFFQLDKSIYFCNQGSQGSVPNIIYEKKNQLETEIELCPDRWFRVTSFNLWIKNKKLLAEYLKVNDENILICDNATESINCALKSIQFNGSKDAILCCQYTYQGINIYS